MEFFMSPSWYIFLVVVIITSFFNFFGQSTSGSNSKTISLIGQIGAIVVLIVNFFFSGWVGGLILVLLYFIILGRLGLMLSFFIFKLFRPKAKYLSYALFKLRSDYTNQVTGSSLDKNSQKKIKLFKFVKEDNSIMSVLSSCGHSAEKIDHIYEVLIRNGSGEFVAASIIVNPKFVREFIDLERNNLSKKRIARYFVDSLGGAT